jgi:hypothetical protein
VSCSFYKGNFPFVSNYHYQPTDGSATIYKVKRYASDLFFLAGSSVIGHNTPRNLHPLRHALQHVAG